MCLGPVRLVLLPLAIVLGHAVSAAKLELDFSGQSRLQQVVTIIIWISTTNLAVGLALVPHAVPHGAHDGGAPTLDPVARAVPALEVVLLGRVLDGNLRRVRPQVSSGARQYKESSYYPPTHVHHT